MSLCLKSIRIFNSIKHLIKAHHDKRLTTISNQFIHTNVNKMKWQKNNGTLSSTSSASTFNKSRNTKDLIKITLMQNQNITVTTLEEAKNIANRRSMHLIFIKPADAKTQRPVYKLVSNAEMLVDKLSEEEPKSLNKMNENHNQKIITHKKSEKFLNIGSRISQHDLILRLKNITKWLTKGHTVRILIQGINENDKNQCEKIYEMINEYLKGDNAPGKIIQKNSKGIGIRLNIIPTIVAVGKANATTTNVESATVLFNKNSGKNV